MTTTGRRRRTSVLTSLLLSVPLAVVAAAAGPAHAAGPTTELISATPDGHGGNESSGNLVPDLDVSDNGRYVVFSSYADNLVSGDSNGTLDAFVRDRDTQTTTRVAVDENGQPSSQFSFGARISDDGRYVLFTAAGPLVSSDTNGQTDAYVRDLVAGTTTLAGVGPGGAALSGSQRAADISADGRYVLFSSTDASLTGDTHGNSGLFVHDRVSGTTTRMDVSTAGVSANDASNLGRISANGRFVSFSSNATNLAPVDDPTCTRIVDPDPFDQIPGTPEAANCLDVFVHDRDPGNTGTMDVGATTSMASVDNSGVQGDNDSGGGAVSDGGDVAFWSYADLAGAGATPGQGDIYVRTHGGQTVLVGRGISNMPVITPDGRYVAFDAFLAQGDASDTNNRTDTFVYDRTTSTVERASVAPDGSQLTNGGVNPSLSSDGRFVAFISFEPSLVPAGSTPNVANVFLRDRTGALSNSPPSAQDSTRSVLANQTSAVTLSASDPDGDALTYSVTSAPSHGTLGGTAPDLTYTPASGYTGDDSLVYTVDDGRGGTASATVSITVGDTTSVSQPAEVGQTVATGSDPTPAQPTQAAVTTPVAGTVSITEDPSVADPAGYSVVGSQYVIEAPAATVGDPLHLTFSVDASSLPAGQDETTLTLFRNGVAIAPCADSSGQASPDPCVASRSRTGDTIRITVLSSHASAWTIGIVSRTTVLRANPAVLKVVRGRVKVTVAVLSARLTVGGRAVRNQTVRFTARNGAPLCTATTRLTGVATCTTTPAGELLVVLGRGFRADFDGALGLAPSSALGGLIKIG